MKDPIVLCPICGAEGQHLRKMNGLRCPERTCGLYREVIATETEVQKLKQMMKAGTWGQFKHWLHGVQKEHGDHERRRDFSGGVL